MRKTHDVATAKWVGEVCLWTSAIVAGLIFGLVVGLAIFRFAT